MPDAYTLGAKLAEVVSHCRLRAAHVLQPQDLRWGGRQDLHCLRTRLGGSNPLAAPSMSNAWELLKLRHFAGIHASLGAQSGTAAFIRLH